MNTLHATHKKERTNQEKALDQQVESKKNSIVK